MSKKSILMFAGSGLLLTAAFATITLSGGVQQVYAVPSAEAESAIESSNYQSWQTAMEGVEADCNNVIDSEEDFAKLVQMHQARESGDRETADAIRKDLVMPEKGIGNGERNGERKGGGNGEQIGARDGSGSGNGYGRANK